jgi:hypothetical protein
LNTNTVEIKNKDIRNVRTPCSFLEGRANGEQVNKSVNENTSKLFSSAFFFFPPLSFPILSSFDEGNDEPKERAHR